MITTKPLAQRLPGILAVFGLALLAFANALGEFSGCAAPAEVRGTWLTTTGNDAISTPQQTSATMRRLRAIGLNTVYVECWANGRAEFPSRVLAQTLPPPPANPATLAAHRNLLDETLNAAHREGLACVAWFEFGFAAGIRDRTNTLVRAHPEWLMTAADGKLATEQNPFIWLNPLRPECQNLIRGIVLEAITNYDLDGVQLDDHMAWPVTLGYDDYTVDLYRKEHAGKSPPGNCRDAEWIAWRAQKVTAFAGELYRACKAANPNILVSISPAIAPWALENYCCNWPRWAAAGWMEEFVPQDYRFSYSAFAETWRAQIAAMPGRKEDLVAGILISEGRKVNSWDDLKKEIELVRSSGAAGHVWWYSKGILNRYAEELTAFYDVKKQGFAPNPKINSRPAPYPLQWISAETSPQKIGRATGLPPMNYRVIGQYGDAWKTIGTIHVTAGNREGVVTVTNGADATALELLPDRRPAITLPPGN